MRDQRRGTCGLEPGRPVHDKGFGLTRGELHRSWTREQLLIRWTYAQEQARQEAEGRQLDMEMAVAHGYLRATVKDYSSKRDRTLRDKSSGTKKPANGLKQLAADMARMGMSVKHGPVPGMN